MNKSILTLSFILMFSLSKAQVTQIDNFTVETPDSITFKQLEDWIMLRGTTSDLMVDYINSESREVSITQDVPVKYRLFGAEHDGGHITMTSTISIYDGKLSYVIDKAEHESAPLTQHRSGGDIFPATPPKGKGIMKKTWLRYQDQLNQFIDEDVTKLKKQLSGT